MYGDGHMSLSILLQAVYQNISFASNFARVDALARNIVELTKEEPNTAPICLLGDEKEVLVILQLAVLRAGRFFVVLDHLQPQSIIQSQISQLGTKLVITHISGHAEKDQGIMSSDAQEVLSYSDLSAKDSTATLPTSIPDDALAYVLLTSGSTGKPKAVMQTHSGLFEQIQRYYRIIGINSQAKENFSNFAPLCHDQGIVDVYAALLLPNATLFLFDKQETLFTSEDGLKLARDFLKSKKISIFSGLPEVFKLIFSGSDQNYFDLRVIAIGAETVSKSHLTVFIELCDKSVLYNSYGTSECSWICGYPITKEKAKDLLTASEIPIGCPDSTLSVFIRPLEKDELDESIVSHQVCELCVAGAGVSPGYFNNKNATRDSFFLQDGKWFYITGDLVEQNGSVLLHKGRLARLEKIAGKRVDINELEKTLSELLKTPIYIVAVTLGEVKMLCAFRLSSHPSSDHSSKPVWSLCAHHQDIQANLASHLRPTYLFELDEFPKLSSGKPDRQALVKIARDNLSESFEFKGSNIERILYSVAKQMLGTISVAHWEEDNISNIMSSIQVARFRTAVNKHLGNETLLFSDIYAPIPITLKKLASLLQNRIDNAAKTKGINIEYYPGTRGDIIFSYANIQRVMSYFMECSPELFLTASTSLQDFKDKIIQQFFSKIPRVGYTVPLNNQEEHASACVAEYDEENNRMILWVSDSLGATLEKSSLRSILYLDRFLDLLKYFSDIPIKIYVDRSSRQSMRDFYNCTFDALNFLANVCMEPVFLRKFIIPSREDSSIGEFQLPITFVHKIPRFLNGSSDNCIFDYRENLHSLKKLGQLYSALILAIKKRDETDEPIPSVPLLIPSLKLFIPLLKQDGSQDAITSLDVSMQLELAVDKNERIAIFNKYKDKLLDMPIETAVLGKILKELDVSCFQEMLEILAGRLQLRDVTYAICIISNIRDYFSVLRYLDKEKREIFYSVLPDDFFKSFMQEKDYANGIYLFAHELMLLSDDVFTEICCQIRQKLSQFSNQYNTKGEGLFIWTIFELANHSQFKIACDLLAENLKSLSNEFRGLFYLIKTSNANPEKVIVIFEKFKDEIMSSIRDFSDLFIVIKNTNKAEFGKILEQHKPIFFKAIVECTEKRKSECIAYSGLI